MKNLASRKTARGFSITEILMALALVAGSALPVLGLLSVGILDAKEAGDHRLTANLRNTVQQLLSDPAWPEEAKPAGEWTAERGFDHEGRLLEPEEKNQAVLLLRLRSLPAIGFESDHLETVQVSFHAPDRPDMLSRSVVQRVKTAP
ncbi:MAG TPA: hypothetical protein DIT64_03410 [Verrucomicrobiales bacterium]|nr:hypothetical protein [Verrucomicrobiales bacterium]